MKRKRRISDVLLVAFGLLVSLGMVAGAVRWAAVLTYPIAVLQIATGLGFLAMATSAFVFGPRHPRTLLSMALGIPLIALWSAFAWFRLFVPVEISVIGLGLSLLLLILSPWLFLHYLRQQRAWREAHGSGGQER